MVAILLLIVCAMGIAYGIDKIWTGWEECSTISIMAGIILIVLLLVVGCGIISDWTNADITNESKSYYVEAVAALEVEIEENETSMRNDCVQWLHTYKGMDVDDSLTLDELVENDSELKNLLGKKLDEQEERKKLLKEYENIIVFYNVSMFYFYPFN